MGVSTLIRALHFSQVKSLWKFFVRNPLWFGLAVFATARCLQISNRHYGKRHSKNGKANAFRHALWNALIMYYCRYFGCAMPEAKRWARDLTTWHEEFSVNKPLAKAMDMHNNFVGRSFYEENPLPLRELIAALKELSSNSVFIHHPEEATRYTRELVYIEEQI